MTCDVRCVYGKEIPALEFAYEIGFGLKLKWNRHGAWMDTCMGQRYHHISFFVSHLCHLRFTHGDIPSHNNTASVCVLNLVYMGLRMRNAQNSYEVYLGPAFGDTLSVRLSGCA